jgi:hypothetical protein
MSPSKGDLESKNTFEGEDLHLVDDKEQHRDRGQSSAKRFYW